MATDEIGQGHELPAMGRARAEQDLTSGLPLRPLLARSGFVMGSLALEALAVLKLPAAVLSPAHWIVAANEFMSKLISGQLEDRIRRVALPNRRAAALLEKALLHVPGQSSSRDVCSIPVAGSADKPPSASEPAKLRVFISYSRDDSDFADQLVKALDSCGFEPLLDRQGITGGEDWKKRLCRRSRSASTTSRPASATRAASARARVLLPTPLLWLTKAITARMTASPYWSIHYAATKFS